MRGLTPIERELLASRAANAPRVLCYGFEPEWAAYAALVSRGRLRAEFDGESNWTYITDLGSLALRVCPVGET